MANCYRPSSQRLFPSFVAGLKIDERHHGVKLRRNTLANRAVTQNSLSDNNLRDQFGTGFELVVTQKFGFSQAGNAVENRAYRTPFGKRLAGTGESELAIKNICFFQ
jgi:hypothetical protein